MRVGLTLSKTVKFSAHQLDGCGKTKTMHLVYIYKNDAKLNIGTTATAFHSSQVIQVHVQKGGFVDLGHSQLFLAPIVAMNLDRGQMVLNMNKDRRACCVAALLLFLVVILSFNFDQTVRLHGMILKAFREGQEYGTNVGSHEARELLEKLRETVGVAAHGQDEYKLTAAEREAWHIRNPCESRSELPAKYAARKRVRDISPNPMWDQILDEYSNLHRICMKRVGSVTDHFLNRSSVTIPGCKFLIVDGKFGLGNKLLVTVSALLYAIVSQRVLLVPSYMTFRSILCEPFVGSSWLLRDRNFPMPQEASMNSWDEFAVFTQKLNDFLKEEQQTGSRSDHSTQSAGQIPPLVDAIVVSAIWNLQPYMPLKGFYCKTEQRYLSEVPWMYLSGCIYTIPELFASPAFGSTLQALFPDRMVITRLLRSAFLPSDSVWSRFKHLNHVYFQHADRRVGIQLRLFDGPHDTVSKLMNDRVMDCVLKNDILPSLNWTSNEDSIISPPPSAPITTVYIASLHSDLHHAMSEFYLRNPTVTGEAVGVVQVSSREMQRAGVEEDREAFVEMLLLSISDSLLLTPTSTFGGISHAFGGLTPWFIRSTEGDGVSCERGQTADPCEQTGILGYECLNNDPSSPPEYDGVLAECLKIDLGKRLDRGFQILDNRVLTSG